MSNFADNYKVKASLSRSQEEFQKKNSSESRRLGVGEILVRLKLLSANCSGLQT
jgi:hypothetical protein